MGYLEFFSAEIQSWFSEHKDLQVDLFEELDDFTNVNTLDNGEPDLRYLQLGISSVLLTIQARKRGIIEGPYGVEHFEMIKQHFKDLNITEDIFWNQFNLNCATKADEGDFTKERLYLSAISEILTLGLIQGVNLNDFDFIDSAYNFNSDEVQKLTGIGVNARWNE